MGVPKERADLLLVQRGLAESRTQAQALILAGNVWSGEVRVDKAGDRLALEAPLELRGQRRYVSRGGDKLEGALADLGVAPTDRVCLDVGASTGGFTDCLLQHGAALVYAVDVGAGLLHPRVAADARVVVRDGTNARALSRGDFERAIELCVADASFISLSVITPALADVLPAGAELLAMVKPQFEVGREAARRHRGVIRDEALREAGVARVRHALVADGFELLGEAPCRVPGPKGNVEHFLHARRRG